MKPVIWNGDLDSPSGYSKAIRNNMRALLTVGVDVIGRQHKHDSHDAPLDEFWIENMPKVMTAKEPPQGKLIKVYQETPEFYHPDPSYYNIAFLVWETDRIPDWDIGGNPTHNWVKQLNKMDEVWTACVHNAEVFRKSGVTKPIYVFPHPIDLELFKPGDRTEMINMRTLAPTNLQKFTLLSVFQWSKRKNPDGLIANFLAEFWDQEDVHLLIKSYGATFADKESVKLAVSELKQLLKLRYTKPGIQVVNKLIPDKELPELYNSCDAFILPSYGEGFGLPYQEAMACGKPTIFTNVTAQKDFCNAENGYPVECYLEPTYGMKWIPWYSAHQNWYKADSTSLRQAMRSAYNDWKANTIQHKGEIARKTIEQLHSYETVGKDFRARIEEIYSTIK